MPDERCCAGLQASSDLMSRSSCVKDFTELALVVEACSKEQKSVKFLLSDD